MDPARANSLCGGEFMGIEGRNESWQRSAYRHQPSNTDRLPVFATLQGYHAFKLKDLGALTQVLLVP